jgi:hypothetical protein
MMIRILVVTIIILAVGLIPAGCKTNASSAEISTDDDMPEDFLSRPRFEKPAPRPLGRVLLSWNSVENAEGYDIQMADTESFAAVEKAWTIRGHNLELPIQSGALKWFRIRSFNGRFSSRWSAPLEVEDFEL